MFRIGQIDYDLAELRLDQALQSRFLRKVFFITGATGLLGSMFVRSLLYLNARYALDIKVMAAVRTKKRAKQVLGDMLKNSALHLVEWQAGEPLYVSAAVDYILHAASITSSKQMVSAPVDTIRTAVYGTDRVLQFAAEKKARVLYLSSMEAYGRLPDLQRDIVETDLGYLDLTRVRTDYGESKRICESLCTAYASEYAVEVVIARLAQSFGAGILPEENRVFAQFARAILHGEDIVLNTTGKSEGNYCYLMDVMMAFFVLLAKGASGNIYNVSNEACHMTIREMAELAAREFSAGRSKVVVDIPEDIERLGYAQDVKMRLSSAKLRQLGWQPRIDLTEAYRRMLIYMKEQSR